MLRRTKQEELYIAPELEVLTALVEQGFTTSFDGSSIDGAEEDNYGSF
jgi:hypothetical protein